MDVRGDIERREKESKSYGYLKLPKNVQIFKEEVTTRKSGRTYIDIIPYIVTDPKHMDANPDNPNSALVGNAWYKKPIYVHRNVGADNETVICLKTIGEKCFCCDYRKQQQKQHIDKDDLIDPAKQRILYVIIPIDHPDYEEDFAVWDIAHNNFQAELDEELKEKPENEEFGDPISGATLGIRFSEEKFKNFKFAKAGSIEFDFNRPPYDENIVEEAPNLDEMIEVLTYEEMRMKFMEIDDEAEEEEAPRRSRRSSRRSNVGDEEEQTRSRRSARRGTRNTEPEEDPEEEPEEDPEEEPRRSRRTSSGSSKPERTSRRSSRRQEPEHDPEEEPNDEEPEEEEPISRRKRGITRTKKSGEEPPFEPDEKQGNPRRSARAKKGAVDECPSGYQFGDDWDRYDECLDCPIFDACGDGSN